MQPLPITLFDSYKKEFVHIKPEETVVPNTLKLYSCGPTIYSYQHIGNMRAAWFNDTVAKLAKLASWQVDWVLNITDVGHLVADGDDGQNVSNSEDKVEKAAKKDGKTVKEIIDFYLSDYLQQASKLGLNLPAGKMMPMATDYIQEQMILALELLKIGKAYLLEDGIYYDSREDEQDNSNSKNDSNYTGRHIVNNLKNSADFALWKFVDENSLQKWRFTDFQQPKNIFLEISEELGIGSDSFNQEIEQGRPPAIFAKMKADEVFKLIYPTAIDFKWGCPGWHSECVAMISEIIGQKRFSNPNKLFSKAISPSYEIDLHTGGIEHIPIHHKNEIIQSEALGFHLSKYWVHFEHLLIDGGKMSKSLGNSYTMWDIIEKGFDPLAYKLLMFEHNYQDQMNFTWDKMAQAQNRLYNLRKDAAKISSYISSLGELTANDDPSVASTSTSHGKQAVSSTDLKKEWLEILCNNLDTAKFLEEYQAKLSELSNLATKAQFIDPGIYDIVAQFDLNLLNLGLFNIDKTSEDKLLSKYQKSEELAEERLKARAEKDFQKSDELRKEIDKLGFQIDDYPWGYGLWRKG
jgi:cysteinyl-tRNA synthetase